MDFKTDGNKFERTPILEYGSITCRTSKIRELCSETEGFIRGCSFNLTQFSLALSLKHVSDQTA
jgi:hypothetical protein